MDVCCEFQPSSSACGAQPHARGAQPRARGAQPRGRGAQPPAAPGAQRSGPLKLKVSKTISKRGPSLPSRLGRIGPEEAAHLMECSKGPAFCVECRWASNHAKWVSKHEWLVARRWPQFGVGCAICAEAGVRSGFGRYAVDARASLQSSNLVMPARRTHAPPTPRV